MTYDELAVTSDKVCGVQIDLRDFEAGSSSHVIIMVRARFPAYLNSHAYAFSFTGTSLPVLLRYPLNTPFVVFYYLCTS